MSVEATLEGPGTEPVMGGENELVLASQSLGNGVFRTNLSVPGMHCGGCMSKVEKALAALPAVSHARVNLSTRRATVEWSGDAAPPLVETLAGVGFEANFVDEPGQKGDPEYRRLVRAMAVAGFASANIMMLSVAVWAGADAASRDLFHWISAAIALPTLLYSGRVFFEPAAKALRRGRTNMDVPISIGVTLAFALSLYETVTSGQHAYFDASVTLLFFLLIGRTLDYAMRDRARSAVKGLANLTPRGANTVEPDGRFRYRPVAELVPGMTLSIAAGERLPVDGRVVSGASILDCAMVTGESQPVAVAADDTVRAGTMNLQSPLLVEVTARARDSFLAEMIRLMEVAEGGRTRYRRLADRVSELYSPVVHLTAAATGLGWMLVGGDWYHSLTIAIAVLIITCPCALGLAVPIVHVVAARKLFENGLLTKDGSAIERLVQSDTVVFDKTGTLTRGLPSLVNPEAIDPQALALAGALARHSRHPLSHAIVEAAGNLASPERIADIEEIAGQGVAALIGGHAYRMGRRSWAAADAPADSGTEGSEVVLSRDGVAIATFAFADAYRDDARPALDALRAKGFEVILLSGDRERAVASAARDLGIAQYHAECLPQDKVAVLERLAAQGRKVVMVGDGLNDAPALAAAHVSIAPSSAADIGRQAADIVFTRPSLLAVPAALSIARDADRLVRQNIGFSMLYNVVAVPIAVLGFVTPLVAALAMSLSSIVVVLNAMRLSRGGPESS
ncbi:heavy metal translocating P-type ATPase [Pelagibacterium lacus]|uniref:Cadmium-translocating P-type ATPase n=1 Tax=Pelagibacterium lacus TaxID=2282655 RepID=A0A369W0Q0_9HYPH|nr:heavy metal translocating P-type ATPase [Pelagibacterium lacus]RDE08098.1 cadmium-translocating P-type ATPase [Pelagibacterium lacus]